MYFLHHNHMVHGRLKVAMRSIFAFMKITYLLIKSSNCVVDSRFLNFEKVAGIQNKLFIPRFVLKVTDFGLSELHAMEEITSDDLETHAFYRSRKNVTWFHFKIIFTSEKIWTAPELLRNPNVPSRGTSKGDVYSFALVYFCPEMLYKIKSLLKVFEK